MRRRAFSAALPAASAASARVPAPVPQPCVAVLAQLAAAALPAQCCLRAPPCSPPATVALPSLPPAAAAVPRLAPLLPELLLAAATTPRLAAVAAAVPRPLLPEFLLAVSHHSSPRRPFSPVDRFVPVRGDRRGEERMGYSLLLPAWSKEKRGAGVSVA
ncbi:atherin-like [Panicum virgatum]|uniref:atherin-like n=1 Tax=Panicum virgatum TaxID=38727 RepID=UPI0019D5329D|nr:atherin-like [Panicum virgatum]